MHEVESGLVRKFIVQHVSKSSMVKKLISEFNYNSSRGDKIAIVGKNGAGESLLCWI
jgi:ATPase subunit of ABC transporter with duplicated ATPase domains